MKRVAHGPTSTPAAHRRTAFGLLFLGLLVGGLQGCLEAPADACGPEKPCPSGQFCAADGVCLQDEICSGGDDDGDGKIDEAPAAAACTHADHSGTCAVNGAGCACTDPKAFDVDGDASNGCEHAITGAQVGTSGEEIVRVPDIAGASGLEAFAVGGLGRVAWVADHKVFLSSPPGAERVSSRSLGGLLERFVADEGAELALFELQTEADSSLWAVVAERRQPTSALQLIVGAGDVSLPAVDLRSAGVTDYGAPTITFVPLTATRFAIAVLAFGRAEMGGPATPLLWLVPLRDENDTTSPILAERAVQVDIGGAASYRANVAPRVQRGPADGTLQTLLVGAPEGLEVPRSEVLINTFTMALEGSQVVARSTGNDRFLLDGTIVSHLAFPADAASSAQGLYLANLVNASATDVNPLALAAIGIDGRFVRSQTAVDSQGNRAVDVALLNLASEALAFIGVGTGDTEAACMPVLAPLGAPDSGNRQISVLMFGLTGAQRVDGVFDPNTPVGALRVGTYDDTAFWGAWTRRGTGSTAIHRARAVCE